jgi:hypothetical protein
MNNTRRTYLLTLNSPSQRALRLWTGKSIHTLRHCSVKEIGGALVEMQKSLNDLQKSMRTLQHDVKEQVVSAPADGVGGTRKKDNGSLKTAARFSGHDQGRASRKMKEATIGQKTRRGPFFRNISQKGDPHGGKGRERSRT